MDGLLEIVDVEPLEGRWIRATFSDGAIKEIDLSEIFATGEAFGAIRGSDDEFRRVRVNPRTRTVEWPGEVDLDPDVLYGKHEPASKTPIERRLIRSPGQAAPFAPSGGRDLADRGLQEQMPRISSFYGIAITMYFRDHPPPHFHAAYGEHSARVSIASGEIVNGSLPPRARRMVSQWAALHRSELERNWQIASGGGDPEPIAPLP